jgi:hypothetical protein
LLHQIAEEKIEAGAADEHVVTVSARDDVVSRSAEDDVVAVFRSDDGIEADNLAQRDGVVQITPDDRERRKRRERTPVAPSATQPGVTISGVAPSRKRSVADVNALNASCSLRSAPKMSVVPLMPMVEADTGPAAASSRAIQTAIRVDID